MRLGPWEQHRGREVRRDGHGWVRALVDNREERQAGWWVGWSEGRQTVGPETGAAGRDAADRAARAMGWVLEDVNAVSNP